MKILIRNRHESKEWTPVESTEYDKEKGLQDMLTNSPSLIPMEDIWKGSSQLVVAIREFGFPGSGNTDILAFSTKGDIAIIECKLATSSEIKRKVIGQILEYAAYLWGGSYDNLDKKIREKRGKRLAELVRESVHKENTEWSEENFHSNVEVSLKKGDFKLVIVVDEINEELEKTIEFLNGCGELNFSFNALEMRLFRTTNTEVLVPHLYPETASQISSKSKKIWTEETFFGALLVPDELKPIIEDIYAWSKNLPNAEINSGGGYKIPTFRVQCIKNKKLLSIFNIGADGNVTVDYGLLTRNGINESILEEFHDSLRAIPSLKNLSPTAVSKRTWFSIKLDAFLNQPEAINQFKEAAKTLWSRINEA